MIAHLNRWNVRFWNIKVDEGPGYSNGGVSRDYALGSIPCGVSCCPCNKRGKCEMPSNIQIGPDGACKFGKVAIEVAARESSRKA